MRTNFWLVHHSLIEIHKGQARNDVFLVACFHFRLFTKQTNLTNLESLLNSSVTFSLFI